MTAPLQWEDPPNNKVLGMVAAGTVVSVRLWGSDATKPPLPSSTGVPPHLLYVAEEPPQGTSELAGDGAPPARNVVGSIVSDTSPATTKLESLSYDLDLGQPILLPYRGRLELTGGGTPGAAYQIVVTRTSVMDQYLTRTFFARSSIELAAEIGVFEAAGVPVPEELLMMREPVQRTLRNPIGALPLVPPTMTFLGVPAATDIKVPRGALYVWTATAINIDWTPSNNNIIGPGPTRISTTTPAGLWMPLGFLSQGMFRVKTGDPTAALISFQVGIA